MSRYFIIFFFLLSSIITNAQDPVVIIDKMQAVLRTINRSTFDLYSKERFGSEYLKKKMRFRMQESPKKVYFKDIDEGVELLYVKGWNSDKGYINPNGFPWINVSLSIYDSKVVEENHHTIMDVGMGFVIELLRGFENSVKKYGKDRSTLYTYKGSVNWNGKDCHKIEMVPPVTFKYINYTTKEDIYLFDLARKLVASDYLIKEKNNISYTRKIRKGTTLSVPTTYAKKVIVYVEKKSMLPLAQFLYDERGLFEQFEYFNFNAKPTFQSNEFTTDCKLYGF